MVVEIAFNATQVLVLVVLAIQIWRAVSLLDWAVTVLLVIVLAVSLLSRSEDASPSDGDEIFTQRFGREGELSAGR